MLYKFLDSKGKIYTISETDNPEKQMEYLNTVLNAKISSYAEYVNKQNVENVFRREAYNVKCKLQQKALDSLMLILNGSSEVSVLQKEYQAELDSVTNDVALYMVDMFPLWSGAGVKYEKGKRVQYNGVLYEVVKEHVSQESWKPDVTPSEYAKVISSISGEIPEWEQPLPTNAYKKGDRVKHNGRYYESTYDGANVWEPGVVGEEYWKDITDEIGEAS